MFHLRCSCWWTERLPRALGIERICFQGLHHVFLWEYPCCKWIWLKPGLQALESNPVASLSVWIFILDLKASDVWQLCSMQNHSTLLAVLVGQFHTHYLCFYLALPFWDSLFCPSFIRVGFSGHWAQFLFNFALKTVQQPRCSFQKEKKNQKKRRGGSFMHPF